MFHRRSSRARAGAMVAAGSLVAAAGLAGLAPGTASASSHREAPGITDLPKYDNTDVYAFVSPDDKDTVTLIGNWIPMEEPGGGPNFYPFATDARYEFHIDNDGDAKADLTYRYTFRDSRVPGDGLNMDSFTGNGTFLYNNGAVTSLQDENLLFRQKYRLEVIDENGRKRLVAGSGMVAPSYVGDASMPDYESLRDEAITVRNGVTSFAGQAEDSFFLDLRVFDLLYGAGCSTEVGNDTLNGYNTNTIALKVPTASLTAGDDPVVGVWSTTSRKTAGGAYTQVSRLGQPLVNEVVIPYKVKNTFNAIDPTQDAAALPFVQNSELAATLNAVCGVGAPVNNRGDLVTIFLTGIKGLNQPETVTPSEQLRLNTSIPPTDDPKRLGALAGDNAGFPNGRRLTDDVVDIALQVVGGVVAGTFGTDSDGDGMVDNADNPDAAALGDAVDGNASGFGSDFPYVALPHSGSVPQSSPAAQTGETIVTGGDGRTSSGGLPTGPITAVALGALLALAGAALARRRPLLPVGVPA